MCVLQEHVRFESRAGAEWCKSSFQLLSMMVMGRFLWHECPCARDCLPAERLLKGADTPPWRSSVCVQASEWTGWVCG